MFPFAELEYEEGPKLLSENLLVKNLPLDCSDSIAPFVPASISATKKALELAALTATDSLCDLGMGNGKILAEAMETVEGLRCVGVELDVDLFLFVQGKYPKIEAIQNDMFRVDLNALGVSVFILYLLPAGLKWLKEKLLGWFADLGSEVSRKRIVTIGYQIEGWVPARIEAVDRETGTSIKDIFKGGESGAQHVYLYDQTSYLDILPVSKQ